MLSEQGWQLADVSIGHVAGVVMEGSQVRSSRSNWVTVAATAQSVFLCSECWMRFQKRDDVPDNMAGMEKKCFGCGKTGWSLMEWTMVPAGALPVWIEEPAE